MFLGNLGHHSPVRRSSRPNVSVLTSRACASSRIGGITQLRVHPPFIIDSVILLVSLLTVEYGELGTSSFNTGESPNKWFCSHILYGLRGLAQAP